MRIVAGCRTTPQSEGNVRHRVLASVIFWFISDAAIPCPAPHQTFSAADFK